MSTPLPSRPLKPASAKPVPPIVMNIAGPADSIDTLELARRAVEAGLDGVGFADSPRLFADPFLCAQRVLEHTALPLAGPCVLGLGLHHPSVVARAAHTLAEHAPGRGLLVVGRGESSVANEQLPAPTRAEYDGMLRALRERLDELFGGGDRPTVLGAASGPRMIAATAARLGGVLIDVGADPRMVGKAVTAALDAGARRCWLFLRTVVTDTADQATAAAAPLIGSCAARMAQAPEWFEVPPADRDRIAAVAAAHDYRRHGSPNAPGDADAPGDVDQPAVQRVHETFLVTGGTDTVAARLQDLSALGVDGVVLAGAVAGLLDRLPDTAVAVRRGLTPAIDRSGGRP